MTATPELTTALQRVVLRVEDDLRDRVATIDEVAERWHAEHDEALARGRTAAAWQAWRDDRATQAAVAWVLTTVFICFCEDNALVDPVWIAGPEGRRQEALDAQLAFFRTHPEATDREWLEDAIDHLRSLPATAALVDAHSALHLVSPSGDAASALLTFWRERGDDGRPTHDLGDPELSTRFLGDLYQDLSKHARETYALLQTPEFVEEFILDQTLEPALRERPLEGFRLIDPTCGSGHFLLGAFARLRDRWDRAAPALDVQARVQLALDAISGVDLNAFAVAIARFRLVIAALQACGLRRLAGAPAFRLRLAVGDSLLHGTEQLHLSMNIGLQSGETLAGFAYATEDLDHLRRILRPETYDVVVGNPPYIAVKDRQLGSAYRQRYRTCKGGYALTVPFMERFFSLAKREGEEGQAGWVGQITSNSFMKREFGVKLIEDFLATKDVRLVVDTSGAYIPGHGTPTVILVGRNQRPIGTSVRAVMGVRGEPERPAEPSRGIVWTAIVNHVDDAGWDDDWVTVADLPRARLAIHPWTLSGGGASEVIAQLGVTSTGALGRRSARIGFMAMSHADELFLQPNHLVRRCALAERLWPIVVEGLFVRDFSAESQVRGWFPYCDGVLISVEEIGSSGRVLWPFRTDLANRATFGRGTYLSDGRAWFEWHQVPRDFDLSSRSIAFAFVATHNHFVLDRGGKVFKQSAPVIKLPATASEDDHLALLGVLNSSTACFWLKQNSHDKGRPGAEAAGADEPWERRFEFTGTTLEDYPVPAVLPLACGRTLDLLAQQLAPCEPAAVCSNGIPTRARLDAARAEHEGLRGQMVAIQEELDWTVYRLYGLLAHDLTFDVGSPPSLQPAERAFAIPMARAVAAGEVMTSWFVHHNHRFTPVTELPAHWPAAYIAVVQRRLDLIATDPAIRLLEKPEYKRRWAAEPWEESETAALRDWLLDRLEDGRLWSDRLGRPAPRTVGQLADEVAREPDLASVLALWEGRPDVPVGQSLGRLLADEAVPYLAALRYTESGARKREAWEQTWALQRREDADEAVGTIPVPPKYTSADFRRTAFWHARGKLDVPKERFILYPDAGRDTDPTPLIGWAGWDHAQQALALHSIIQQRELEGWADERLLPLVAGLAELQPWVDQWHSGIDAATGVDLAAFCRELLTSRAAQVGRTLAQLAERPPEPAARGRRRRTTGATT